MDADIDAELKVAVEEEPPLHPVRDMVKNPKNNIPQINLMLATIMPSVSEIFIAFD